MRRYITFFILFDLRAKRVVILRESRRLIYDFFRIRKIVSRRNVTFRDSKTILLNGRA